MDHRGLRSKGKGSEGAWESPVKKDGKIRNDGNGEREERSRMKEKSFRKAERSAGGGVFLQERTEKQRKGPHHSRTRGAVFSKRKPAQGKGR